MTTVRMGMILTCGRISRWKEPCRKSSSTKDKHGHSFSDSLGWSGPGGSGRSSDIIVVLSCYSCKFNCSVLFLHGFLSIVFSLALSSSIQTAYIQ